MHALMRRSFRPQIWRKHLMENTVRTANGTTIPIPIKEKPVYGEVISRRQAEATRSIVVQVSSEKSFGELYNYCSTFGSIVGAFHYTVDHEDQMHYILLEFAKAEEAAAAIDASSYNENITGVPVRSPFLWFKATAKRALKTPVTTDTAYNLQIVNGTHAIHNNELDGLLLTAPHIKDQILLLHQRTQLNDLGVRLRFLAAFQVQQAISGMFPAANAQPFGSSVNGFGKMGCDLDLILRFDRELQAGDTKRQSDARLIFHMKENLTNGRSQTQRQMESIGDMLQLFLPGVCHVRRILQARVPIIKYHHEHMDLEVDLSMSNLTGFYMSELLYMFGELDDRVRPLVFCIRRWAHTCGLTNPSPGRWITNFSLTCLVVFFLQQIQQPILPTITTLIKSSTEQDLRLTEDGINCTFGRNFERIGFNSHNTYSVSELLLQFFEFYSQFDFNNRAISLNEGRALPKPDHTALYIVNPLEQVLNVSKNVSLEECERLRIELRNAAWVLESEVENQISQSEKLKGAWGLLKLFKTPQKSIIQPNYFFKPRMVDVSELFNASENLQASPPSPKKATSPPLYKNEEIKQQIRNIKSHTRANIKQMRMNVSSSAGADENLISKGRRSRGGS